MILTYYEYINERKDVPKFIKELPTVIVGNIFKDIKTFDIIVNDLPELNNIIGYSIKRK